MNFGMLHLMEPMGQLKAGIFDDSTGAHVSLPLNCDLESTSSNSYQYSLRIYGINIDSSGGHREVKYINGISKYVDYYDNLSEVLCYTKKDNYNVGVSAYKGLECYFSELSNKQYCKFITNPSMFSNIWIKGQKNNEEIRFTLKNIVSFVGILKVTIIIIIVVVLGVSLVIRRRNEEISL